MQVQKTVADADKAPNQPAALLVTTVGSFLTPFLGSSIAIALPSIGKQLSMNAILLGWVSTAYLLAAAMFLVPLGRIADIYGRKRIFTLGVFTYAIASMLSALSTSAAMLISLQVLQGIGAAMIFGTAVAILTSVFPANERGRALGINVAAVYIGLSLGPFLGGLLTQYFGWRSIFWVNVPLCLLIIALLFWKLKGEWAEARGEKFDVAGSVIYSLMLIAVMYGFTRLPEILGVVLILVGAAGFAGFVIWETRVKSPVLDIGLFRHNTVFALSNMAALINYSATFAVSFLLSLYLQYIKGFNPEHAGLVLIAAPVMQAVFSPVAGRLSDRIEPRIVASAGMGLTLIGLAFFIFLSSATNLWYIIAGLLIIGTGFAFFSSPNVNAVMSSVDRKRYGVASATLATMRQIGMTFSMGTVMMIFGIYIGHVQITPQYYPAFINSVNIAFIIFAVLCLGGIFASLARGKLR
ncbi:MAG: MFS transporter [Dehalococcoidia bacterium]|nr:MFS transporter [Dehalococcoidia bacterium]